MPSTMSGQNIIFTSLITENPDIKTLFDTYKHTLDSAGNTLLHAACIKNLPNLIEQLGMQFGIVTTVLKF